MGIFYNTSIVKDGLVLYLDAANPKSYPGSGTVWSDLSGNGFNALPVGASFPTFNSSTLDFTFNGSTQYLHSLFTGTITSRTLIAWCKLRTLTPTGSSVGEGVLNIGGDGVQSGSFDSIVYNEYTAKRWCNGSEGWARTPNMISPTDETSTNYLMMALTHTTSNYNLYRNATLLVNTTTYSQPSYTNGQFFIGNRHSTTVGYSGVGNGYFDGNIQMIQVYNRVLTSTELTQNFEAMRDRFGI